MIGGAAVAVEFGVLGGIEARIGGHPIDLGHARQRLLLAALLIDLNHEVSTDQLAERLWGEGEQAQRGTLYSYLSRLRRVLAAVEGVEILRRSAGYALVVDATAVDLYRFRDLVAQARMAGDDRQAAELFGQALGLWQGEALSGANTAWANTVREELHQERLAAELDCGEVRLRLGQHSELLAGLRARAGEYPLDERLAGQVMLALYRCGRTADALGHYQETRRLLAEELGATPGPELRRLHQQIFPGDPTSSSEGGAVPRVVPRQLPAPPVLFTGRESELAQLSAALEGRGGAGGTVVVSAIGGTGGIGKTYLALHWAHDHVDRFPDGQLYVNLRGFDPSGQPLLPSVVVRGFLEVLGVASSAVPSDLEAQVGLYRSLVADRRMLVVLDNARDATQVVPLLPGSSMCTVLVTSRHQLTGLVTAHAAKPLALDALIDAEARLLLARHLGEDRLAAEPEAVAALLEHCGGLPLALSIVAARAATQPDFPLAYLAEELAEASSRLDALDTSDLSASLRTVFSSSYQALNDAVASAFALLGLAVGADISLHAAASLVGVTPTRTRALLRTLEAAYLVQQHAPGRYRMHDLVRLYAAEHGHSDLDEQDRTRALRRLVDFYLHTAHHAGLLLEPHPVAMELEPLAAGCTPHRLTNRKAALTWYDTEYPGLLAAQQLAADHRWHTPVWQLPLTLYFFHRSRDHFRNALGMWQIALAATEHLSDPRPKAVAHCYLGYFCTQANQNAEALAHLDQALPVFEQIKDLSGQAVAHLHIAWASRNHDPRRGLRHAERARELCHSLGNTVGVAFTLIELGWCHTLLREYEQGRACCEEALGLARAVGNSSLEAWALNRLGFAVQHSGQYTQALTYHHQALTRHHNSGSTFWEAVVLFNLGETHRALSQIAEARQAWERARDLYRAQHRTAEVERVQQQLDALDDASNDG